MMEKGNNENEASVGKDVTLQISQALAAELKAGFTGAMHELNRIQHGDQFVEERIRAFGTEWQEQLKEMKDTFRTFKEELQGAHNQIREMSERQREMKEYIEMLQQENDWIQTKPLAHNSKMWNGEDEKSEDRTTGHKTYYHKTYENYEPALNQHYFSSPFHYSFQKAHSPDTEEGVYSSSDVHQRNDLASPMLTDHQDFQGQIDTETMTEYSDNFKDSNRSRYGSRENELETNHLINQLDSKKLQHQKEKYLVKRQQAAVELLESERAYMFYLSLILKTSVTVKGKDVILNSKDLRNIFPSSLRVLTQQHVCVLHTLEERVFRWQWQGIVGDIFMKLINGDDDKFLENYIIYLKELPECVSILNICSGDSLKFTRQHEDDCDEVRPDLLTLLFQPVQRIPEYVVLLQNILKYTEQNHPDYYLLLLCIQQFQTFMCRCSHLFQYNEELLTQNRAELKRLTVPQSRLKVSEKNQSMKSDEWEFTPQRYERFDNPDYRPFYTSELDLGPKSSTLKSALEVDSETCCRETRGYFNSNKARSIIGPSCPICPSETYAKNFPADYKTFLNRGEGELGHEEQETSCNPDDEESIQNASLLDQCSFASSDSSLDVRFMKTLNYIPARDPESTGCSLVLTPKHSAVEEDTDAIHKHLCYEAGHPVFNEAQTENYARNIMENVKIPISLSLSNIGSPALKTEGASLSQIKGSINKRLQKTITSSSRSEVDNKQTTDVWMELERVQNSGTATSAQMEDMCKLYKKEVNEQTAYSHSRKQEQKGGFRNSFRKLFKKKSNQSCSSSETKHTPNENPTQETTMTADQEFLARIAHVDHIDRGTAV
ncbi:rho guanine nucleotide exchange factor 33 isoform X2 [Callorhinchus milii]|uniref:rho guanine nucleotide exchange factor 33 isoform X2 n=1 Tax=Callorhinchus milii TaxID=7868 RepID=UPI00045755C9|nr:rho guanine nucleotide exchange factor 33 isoform X2 [Callorhinchus milii]|eukprot:gi/632953706/ref/XP_007892570.1/ PREDICTED: rho guanine nucleotide exchange factor 33 isoform X2 [Callorhinchus milii]